jgi:hypothetical protein
LDDKDPIYDSSESKPDDGADCVALDDELFVDDERGCDKLVHATDLGNPRIEVGITFVDGYSFKKDIRQYAINVNMKLQLPILSRQGRKPIANLNCASGGYMLHIYRMVGHGTYLF